jgi:hypothetical protein
MEGALAGATAVDVVLTDHNVNINNGVVFLRNSPWSARLLDDWLAVGRSKPHGRWSWDDQVPLLDSPPTHRGSDPTPHARAP